MSAQPRGGICDGAVASRPRPFSLRAKAGGALRLEGLPASRVSRPLAARRVVAIRATVAPPSTSKVAQSRIRAAVDKGAANAGAWRVFLPEAFFPMARVLLSL